MPKYGFPNKQCHNNHHKRTFVLAYLSEYEHLNCIQTTFVHFPFLYFVIRKQKAISKVLKEFLIKPFYCLKNNDILIQITKANIGAFSDNDVETENML